MNNSKIFSIRDKKQTKQNNLRVVNHDNEIIPIINVSQGHNKIDIFQQLKSQKQKKSLTKKRDLKNTLRLDYRDTQKSFNLSKIEQQPAEYNFQFKDNIAKKSGQKILKQPIFQRDNKQNYIDLSIENDYQHNKPKNNFFQRQKQRKIDNFFKSKQSSQNEIQDNKKQKPIKESTDIKYKKDSNKVKSKKDISLDKLNYEQIVKLKKKKEMLQRQEEQKKHDKKLKEVLERSNKLLQDNKGLLQNFQINQHSNQIQFQTMNYQQIEQKINNNSNLDFLLKFNKKLKITKTNMAEYKIPNTFNSVFKYQQYLLVTYEDEIRSSIQSDIQTCKKKIDKEEQNSQENLCTLYYLQKTNHKSFQFVLKFDKDTIKKKDFFQDLDKGLPLIQISYGDEKHLGIKYTDNNNKNGFVFDFILKKLDEIDQKKQYSCRYINNLKPSFREVQCLSGLIYINCSLLHKILQPYTQLFTTNQLQISQQESSKLNLSQQTAIDLALSKERLILIQGPPGTGKSFTIVHLLKQIIKDNKYKGKILICTPSNCALDNLLMRIVKEFKINKQRDENGKFKIIRMGVIQDSTPQKVLDFSINYIVNMNYENKTQEQIDKILQKLYKQLEQSQKKYNKMKQKDDKEMRYLEDQIFITKLAKSKHFKLIKERLILESKIIFSTLNSSSVNTLQSLRDQLDFLIVDEATQATEVQNLIPWKYNPYKVILVGDPKQLPATTFHPLSDELNINRSLFERLQTLNFPLQMLDTQYRMIQNLCTFSSEQFYNKKLLTAENLKDYQKIPEKLKIFLKKKYEEKNLVFKQINGKAIKINKSYFNRKEIEFTLELASELNKQGCTEIGIITPYSEQVKRIRIELELENLKNIIEVNTVDGYQGREKNIILISCVRTDEKGIGFLNDPRRLNVALTRAKYAVFIIGDKYTLKRDKLWKKLIKTIEERRGIFQLINQQWDKLLEVINRVCITYSLQKKLINCINDLVNLIRIKKERSTSKNFMIFLPQLKIHLLKEL